MNKLKQIQENNILIPKKKDEKTQAVDEIVGKDEDQLVNRLQQEVRVLH